MNEAKQKGGTSQRCVVNPKLSIRLKPFYPFASLEKTAAMKVPHRNLGVLLVAKIRPLSDATHAFCVTEMLPVTCEKDETGSDPLVKLEDLKKLPHSG